MKITFNPSGVCCREMTFEVNENNISAINLYKKYKFETVGMRKKYYNGKCRGCRY